MPCFTAHIDASGQLLANVWVTDSAKGEDALNPILADFDPEKLDAHDVRYCRAILDTGANRSCITERLAESLNLNIYGVEGMASVSESTEANLYRVNVHVPFSGKTKNLGDKIVQEISVSNWMDVRVLGIPGIEESFDVLLGIDFIRQGALHVSGGHFTFCI